MCDQTERAAIMEYDGGLSREDAERYAELYARIDAMPRVGVCPRCGIHSRYNSYHYHCYLANLRDRWRTSSPEQRAEVEALANEVAWLERMK